MAEVKSYTRLWPLAFAVIGVVGLVYAGFNWLRDEPLPVDVADAPDEPIVDPGPDEHFEKVREHLVDDFTTYKGQVHAGSPIVVRAPKLMRVPVVKVHHEQGDFVKKGDVLLTLDRPQIEREIEKAKQRGDWVDAERFKGYLDFVELKAPVDAVVVSIDRTIGEVPIDDGIGMVTLADKSSFRFVVQVPGEVQRSSMQLGTKFDVVLEQDLGTVKGVVVQFDNPVGSDVPVVLALDPHEGIEEPLSGSVRVASGRIEAGLIPRTAVSKRGDVSIVRVWDSKAITERTVKLGAEIGPDVVVLGGVFAGDSIVVPGRKPPP